MLAIAAAAMLSILSTLPPSSQPAPTPRSPVMLAQAQGTQPAVECVSNDEKMMTHLKTLRVRFEFNEDKLSQEARDTLVEVARWLKTQPKLVTTITGHADERGTEEYNMALGERRARNITSYLESLGVPAANLKAVSYGEEKPEGSSNGDAEMVWAANRRVEFHPTGEIIIHDTTCKQGTENVAETKKEEEQPKQEQVAQTDPNAGKNSQASSGSGKRFPWLPIWLGPLVMALSVPPALLSVPFLLSIVYLGPSVWKAPGQCQEPVSTNGNAVSSNPLVWCGSGWSVAQHADQRQYAVPALLVGIGGALLTGGAALITLGVGAVLTVMAFLPGDEQTDAERAAAVAPEQRN